MKSLRRKEETSLMILYYLFNWFYFLETFIMREDKNSCRYTIVVFIYFHVLLACAFLVRGVIQTVDFFFIITIGITMYMKFYTMCKYVIWLVLHKKPYYWTYVSTSLLFSYFMYNKEENRKYFVISLIDLKSRNAPYCGFVINFLTRIQ